VEGDERNADCAARGDTCNERGDGGLQDVETRQLRVAELQNHLSRAWHDAWRAGLELDAPDVPDGLRAGMRAQLRLERAREADEGGAGVAAQLHGRGAGVVALAGEDDAQLADANDGGDDADALARRLEPATLLDMRLEIGGVSAGLDADQGAIGDACRAQ